MYRALDQIAAQAKEAKEVKENDPIMICVFNEKGGVGKTTAALNIGKGLNDYGLTVLLLDVDPQGSLSAMIKPENASDFDKAMQYKEHLRQEAKNHRYSSIDYIFHESIYPAIRNNEAPTELERASHVVPLRVREYKNLYYIQGSSRLSRVEKNIALGLNNVPGNGRYKTMMPDIFREIGKLHNFDIILIDLNPGITSLNQSILMNSDYLLAPFDPALGCLDAVNNLIEIIPEWFDHARKEDGFLAPDKGPRFLGTFPQIMRVRKKNDIDILEKSFKIWMDKIFDRSKALLDVFIDKMPSHSKIPFDDYGDGRIGIVDMIGAGRYAQTSGYPMSDLDYPHTGPDERPFTKEHLEKKVRVHLGYKKIIATFFKFLTKEHKEKLEQKVPGILSTFLMHSMLELSVRGEKSAKIPPVPTPRKRKRMDRHWYTDAEITVLLEFYLKKSGVPNTHVTTPMQGDGDFSIEDLAKNIHHYLLENIVDESNEEPQTIFIPLNTGALEGDPLSGGIHWTLAIVKYDPSGLQEICFFDPLGKDIPHTINEALLLAINQLFNLNLKRVNRIAGVFQHDSYNCGPWIVEAACHIVCNKQELLAANNIEMTRKSHAKVIRNNAKIISEQGPKVGAKEPPHKRHKPEIAMSLLAEGPTFFSAKTSVSGKKESQLIKQNEKDYRSMGLDELYVLKEHESQDMKLFKSKPQTKVTRKYILVLQSTIDQIDQIIQEKNSALASIDH